jgi:lipoprotein-releasing system ATP-binding protein
MHLQIEQLTKNYYLGGQSIPVLQGIDLEIRSGDFASLTGPSGVGKSTLLHVLGTLDSPSTGTVRMDGQNIFEESSAAIANFRNKNIGFVFQFHHLLPEFTALENVMMPAQILRTPEGRAQARAKELLDDVGLSHRLEHRPGELSGGEQQRVALARSLMNDPRILLADEPTGNLDVETGAGIHDVMLQLNRERGFTVVVVTHNPQLAARMPRQLKMTTDGIQELLPPASEDKAEPGPVENMPEDPMAANT